MEPSQSEKTVARIVGWTAASVLVFSGWMLNPSTTHQFTYKNGHIHATDLISLAPNTKSDKQALHADKSSRVAHERAWILIIATTGIGSGVVVLTWWYGRPARQVGKRRGDVMTWFTAGMTTPTVLLATVVADASWVVLVPLSLVPLALAWLLSAMP